MTDRELLQQALEALELLAWYENPATKVQVRKPRGGGPIVTMYPHKVATEAAAPLRERLAQPQQVERVECTRCGRILADVPPEPVVPDNFAARWRNLVSAVRELHGPS